MLWLQSSPLAPHWGWLRAGVCPMQWVSAWRVDAARFCEIPAAGGGWAWLVPPGRLGLQQDEPGRLHFLCSQMNKGRATERGLRLSPLEGEEHRLLPVLPLPRKPSPRSPLCRPSTPPPECLLSARADAEDQCSDLLSGAGHHVGYQGIYLKSGERCGQSRLTEKRKHL